MVVAGRMGEGQGVRVLHPPVLKLVGWMQTDVRLGYAGNSAAGSMGNVFWLPPEQREGESPGILSAPSDAYYAALPGE